MQNRQSFPRFWSIRCGPVAQLNNNLNQSEVDLTIHKQRQAREKSRQQHFHLIGQWLISKNNTNSRKPIRAPRTGNERNELLPLFRFPEITADITWNEELEHDGTRCNRTANFVFYFFNLPCHQKLCKASSALWPPSKSLKNFKNGKKKLSRVNVNWTLTIQETKIDWSSFQ